MIKELDQELLDYLIPKIKEVIGFNIYPALPPSTMTYPFAVIQEIQIIPLSTMDRLLGTAHLRIDVWGNKNDRPKVSKMIGQIRKLSNYIELSNRKISYKLDNSRIMPDNSTQDLLWHGVLQLELNII